MCKVLNCVLWSTEFLFSKNFHTERNLRHNNMVPQEKTALAGVAQWTELRPAKWEVTGSIPSEGTCLGCRPSPQLGAWEKQPIIVSLPLFLPPLPSVCVCVCVCVLRKINKIFFKKKRQTMRRGLNRERWRLREVELHVEGSVFILSFDHLCDAPT